MADPRVALADPIKELIASVKETIRSGKTSEEVFMLAFLTLQKQDRLLDAEESRIQSFADLEFYLFAKLWLATENLDDRARKVLGEYIELLGEALATVNAINVANLGRAKKKLSGLTKVPDETKLVIAIFTVLKRREN